MSIASVNGIDLFYKTYGNPENPPLLLNTGLSGYHADWWAQVPAFQDDFYVITFDNRSAGQSTWPEPGYTMADMADDVAGLLDFLNIESAYVFGISMGGMMAQNLAIRHPHKVRKLALGCTNAGGINQQMASADVIANLTDTSSTGDVRQDILNGAWTLLADGALERMPHIMDRWIEVSTGNPQTEAAYMAQLQAIATHDVFDQLGSIQMPTLVLHGEDDVLVPVENGRIIANAIPHAKLKTYPSTAHMFFWEAPEAVNADLRAFFLGE